MSCRVPGTAAFSMSEGDYSALVALERKLRAGSSPAPLLVLEPDLDPLSRQPVQIGPCVCSCPCLPPRRTQTQVTIAAEDSPAPARESPQLPARMHVPELVETLVLHL
jgi:hypothetical protein